MPVMKKTTHEAYLAKLRARFENLIENFESRDLKNASEGTGRRSTWIHPEEMCATKGNHLDLTLAIEDFKAILAELKRIK
jgi:hypothetical protein